jgi:hypothetical protein
MAETDPKVTCAACIDVLAGIAPARQSNHWQASCKWYTGEYGFFSPILSWSLSSPDKTGAENGAFDLGLLETSECYQACNDHSGRYDLAHTYPVVCDPHRQGRLDSCRAIQGKPGLDYLPARRSLDISCGGDCNTLPSCYSMHDILGFLGRFLSRHASYWLAAPVHAACIRMSVYAHALRSSTQWSCNFRSRSGIARSRAILTTNILDCHESAVPFAGYVALGRQWPWASFCISDPGRTRVTGLLGRYIGDQVVGSSIRR